MMESFFTISVDTGRIITVNDAARILAECGIRDGDRTEDRGEIKMIRVPLTDEQYKVMQPYLDMVQAAAIDGKPGMVIAQIGTGTVHGEMRVFFLPNQVAFDVQKLMAKHSKGRAVLPGTMMGKQPSFPEDD